MGLLGRFCRVILTILIKRIDMQESAVKEIAEEIGKKINRDRLTLIGIDGFGGSGKTTIAKRLADYLGNAYVVGMDDFIIKEKLTVRSADEVDFDRERLSRQILAPALDNRSLRYQKLIWAENRLSEFIEIPTVDFLIIEGVSSCHPKIENYYDFKIWIDTPMEIAKARGHARDGSNENAANWEIWAENNLAYMDKYHPEQRADFAFKNS